MRYYAHMKRGQEESTLVSFPNISTRDYAVAHGKLVGVEFQTVYADELKRKDKHAAEEIISWHEYVQDKSNFNYHVEYCEHCDDVTFRDENGDCIPCTWHDYKLFILVKPRNLTKSEKIWNSKDDFIRLSRYHARRPKLVELSSDNIEEDAAALEAAIMSASLNEFKDSMFYVVNWDVMENTAIKDFLINNRRKLDKYNIASIRWYYKWVDRTISRQPVFRLDAFTAPIPPNWSI